jgi:lysylphosphatidylglycerol synthetase-like protein (DUF2156 family)
LPLEFLRFPRSFTPLIGFALVISAANIYRRKRRAFHLVLALSALSVVAYLMNQFFQRLTSLFSFGGLKAYKAKFASLWEPRYVIYRHALDLPKVGIALGKVSKLK